MLTWLTSHFSYRRIRSLLLCFQAKTFINGYARYSSILLLTLLSVLLMSVRISREATMATASNLCLLDFEPWQGNLSPSRGIHAVHCRISRRWSLSDYGCVSMSVCSMTDLLCYNSASPWKLAGSIASRSANHWMIRKVRSTTMW
jgi:hypothetical protein